MAIYMDPEMMDKMNKLKAVSEEEIFRKLNKARRGPGGSSHLVQQRLKAEAARSAVGESGHATPLQSKAAALANTGTPAGPSKKAAKNEDECDDEEELVGGSSDGTNWKGIVLAILVILLILGLIVVAVILVTPDMRAVEKFTFEDILDPRFKPKAYDVDWVGGSIYIRQAHNDNVLIVDLNQNDTRTLIDNRTVEETESSKFWVNSDQRYVLLACKVKKLYRHSFTAVYRIYDVESKLVQKEILKPPDIPGDSVRLQYVSWAPAGTGLVFVYDNNIYYQEALGRAIVKITDTGEEQNVFNGVPDWVYEEEMLESNTAIYWGPDNTHLVYASFNDTLVKRAWCPDYNNYIYSKTQEYPYPKAGETNPLVKLYMQSISISNGQVDAPVELTPPSGIAENDYYYKSVTWIDKYKVAVEWLNRPQNYSVTTICQIDSGECLVNHDYITPNGWIVMRGSPIFSESGQSYVYIYPHRVTGVGNFFHIAVSQVNVPLNSSAPNVKDGSKEEWKGGRSDDRLFLTQGTWEVTKILGYSEVNRVIYYISTETSPHDRHLYNVSIDIPYKRSCLSCNVRSDCQFFDASFSKDFTWYRLHCQGSGVPQTTFHNIQTGDVYLAEDNKELNELLAKKAYPVKRIIQTTLDDGRTIYLQFSIPGPDLSQIDENRKHPVLIHVYGGPGSQRVNNKFELGWHAYLASRYHMQIISIDGRGAGFYGEDNLYAVYKNLGQAEIEDQIAGAQFLMRNKTLDPNKFAIWGWSYGGFATASVLGRGTDLFKCGIAVAPVTDWRYYDSIYTERYMGLPDKLDNLQAYIASNVSDLVSNMHNSRLLLVHGTADDNVHFQNSADLVRALVEEEIQHQVQFYPDEGHSLVGDYDPYQKHLYRMMINHLDEYMKLPGIE